MNFNRKRIDSWDEAIPFGNGHMGGLLFGDSQNIKLNLDCSSLWDLRRNEATLRDDFTFKHMKELILKGEDYNAELQKTFGDFYEDNPYPTKIPTGCIVFEVNEDKRDTFFLNLNNAFGGVKLLNNTNIETFFSANNNLGYLRFPKDISFKFVPPSFIGEITSNSLSRLGYKEGSIYVKDNIYIYRQPIYEGYYSVLILTKEVGNYKEVIFSIIVNSNEQLELEEINKMDAALNNGYEFEFNNHKAWWNSYFNKSSISFPFDSKDIEEQYNLTVYLLGSGSKKGYPPMPLQGVWTAADDTLPPWKGDYHFDLNVQGTYYFAFRAGRIDQIFPLVEYFIKNYDYLCERSDAFFQQEGTFFIPGAADLNGNVMGGWVQYTYSIASSIWMVLLLDKWYEFTNDKDYLNNFLLPLHKRTFNTLMWNFLEKKDNEYYFIISISPEINNNYYSAWVKNSTYDISIIKDFLTRYIARLKESSLDYQEVKEVLDNLKKEPIGDTGYLLGENMALCESHRHMSHCMNIFPLQALDYLKEEDLNLMNATLGNLEKQGTSWWVGFSFVWMAALYASSGNGEGAKKYLDIFLEAFTSPNGFHFNGDYKRLGYSNFDYRPFTLEANGMFNDSVQEMLMQYHHDILRLFPAIPQNWEKGCSFKGFYLESGLIISASYKDGHVDCEIYNPVKISELTICLGKKLYKINLQEGENKFSFDK